MSHTPGIFSSLGKFEWLLIALIVISIVLTATTLGLGNPQVAALVATSTATPVPTATHTPTFTATPTQTPPELPTQPPTPTNTPTPTVPPPPSGSFKSVIPLTATYTISNTPVPTPAAVIDLPEGVINVLLMGTDRRPNDTAWRTDTLIVVSINTVQHYVTMLSIPRDLWVYIPWENRFDRINTADSAGERHKFPGGGAALLEQTILYNLGIPINYYARIDFTGVRDIIDKVGGVDVLAQCPLYDVFPDVPDTQSDIITDPAILATVPTGTINIPTPGLYTLDGKHALWFARSRYTTSDFDRSRRQQAVLRALWAKIKAEGLVAQLPNLWGDLTSLITTDLSLNDVAYLAAFGSGLDDAQIKMRALDRSVTQSFVTGTGAEVLLIQPDRLGAVLQEAFEPPLSNVASQATASVQVWNGSGNPNWDLLAVERLTSQGFSVPSYGPADRAYTHPLIINFGTTAKGSRPSQLLRLFNVKSSQLVNHPDANSPVAFRVIVGPDFDSCKQPAPPVVFPATPTPTPTPQP